MRINNIRQLRAKRHQVNGRMQFLEDKICTDWQDLKKHLAGTDTMKEVTTKNIFKGIVALGLKLAATKAVEKILSKAVEIHKK